MKSPITGKEMKIMKETIEMEFRKEKFPVVYHYYLCEDSLEKFEDESLTQLNLDQVSNQYRIKHGLPFPEEIVGLRESYGLSASKMAEVLRFGINIYRHYENGEIPNASNALLLQLARDPKKFKDIVISSDVLSIKERAKVLEKVEELIVKEYRIDFRLEDYFMGGTHKVSEETGFKRPNLEKFGEMVVYFSETAEPFKTKLNKMLFYADFYHFKKTGLSISGARYRAIDMGPVPNNFHGIFEYLEESNMVGVNRVQFAETIGEQFKGIPNKKFNHEIFTAAELKTLEEVVTVFGKMTTEKIVNVSHGEEAWKKNFEQGKKVISYLEGFNLKAI
jgi:transcriptional regulator with XRE-family HTH domain